MRKLRQKFTLLLTLFILVVGLGSWLVLTNFFPQLLFQYYPIIPVFFFIIGIVSIYTLTGIKLDKPNKLLNTFMLVRGVKMFLALSLAAVYWLFNRAEIKSFAIMVVVFYLLYLFLETYIYIKLEKWNRKNLSQTNKEEDQ
ncbi:MAG: hypothetical protein GX921_03065 [Bacteroidales bacterium]|nr:hypothetical protein [Bacteroidales bacterium]